MSQTDQQYRALLEAANKVGDQPRDDATGAATVTAAPGLKVDVVLDNQNGADNRNSAGGYGYGGWGYPGYGWGGYGYTGWGYPGVGGVVAPGVVLPGGGGGVAATEVPTASPTPMPTSLGPSLAPLPAPMPIVSPSRREAEAGTRFCMGKGTFTTVLIMLLVASSLAALGYYIWRKKGAAASGGGGGGNRLSNNLGPLNLGLGANRMR